MPQLSDDMYCSEQIDVPPPFPYLLRQFAKAAIRTQPVDLLKWSTAYFRCLSLNIPPPVKPRLEYPIPSDYYGMTPGWLKALLFQLQGNKTVSFKVLWDRWTGACLQHDTLIKILCLGGFDDPSAIPWLRFVGLCVAHFTESLTSTMKMICEIVTEEPEGGSAMIPLQTFLDLYQFLAAIDASKPQILKNIYFTDSLLSLWREKAAEEEKPKEELEESIVEVTSMGREPSEETIPTEVVKVVSKETISCPSIAGDDNYSIHIDEYESREGQSETEVPEVEELMSEQEAPDEELVENVVDIAADSEEDDQEETEPPEQSEEGGSEASGEKAESLVSGEEAREDAKGPEEASEEEEDDEEEEEEGEEGKPEPVVSVDTILEKVPTIEDRYPEEDDSIALKEDLARLKALQSEIAGETDDELEKFKCRLIEDMPLSGSQLDAIATFKPGKEKETQLRDEKEEESVEEVKYEDVYVDAVPGIGPIVPAPMVEAVNEYMKKLAVIQHGMVMPRNIRHYSCPPLEKLGY